MTARDIVKDIGEVYSRIFDHRPFTSAEIQYFVKEFEEKRSDREVENLFHCLQNTSETKDSGVSRCRVACEGHLEEVKRALEVALGACEEVCSHTADPKLAETLEANRVARKDVWSHFVDDMAHKCSRVDHTFEQKEEELRDFYLDLERKLHIHQ
ncbi:biogenesis of lysosome-related organelles complex 1 subunit 5 [Phlebotomus argentipes]|uniref:biogenesis of lysosome-related organelles complex 1 subunit 5 n=1 Tax=Phlebotomus argentipes TaxID=94469 RepID=UPI002892AB9D|nr:biogenesis of lysosome-related organelles complex 1 subunit 5 [Phlebotomus argentipes]